MTLLMHMRHPHGFVGAPPGPVIVPTSLRVSPSSFTLQEGAGRQLGVQVLDQFGEPITEVIGGFIWLSNKPSIATVDQNGRVTGVAAGDATITCVWGTLSASVTLTVVQTSELVGWSDERFPHSSTGLLFTYTDFRTSYFGTDTAGLNRKATEMAFIARKVDKVLSGGEPSGGYPEGLIHQPYVLVSFIACCIHDTDYWRNMRSKTDWWWEQWCDTHGKDPENGYLHYADGENTYGTAITSIDTNGRVTLKYDMVTYTDGFLRDGDTVTISGAQNPVFDGEWTISDVGVIGGDLDQNGHLRRAQTVFNIAKTGATSGAGGTVFRKGDGTKTKRNRYVFDVPSFPPPRWIIDHAHPDRIAFEKERFAGLVAGEYGQGFIPEGFYVDEIAKNVWGRFVTAKTVQYPTGGGQQWVGDMAAFYAALKADYPDQPWMFELGTASYMDDDTTRLIVEGSKCTQLEQLGNTHTRFEWVPGAAKFEWVRNLVRQGVHVEWCTPYTPQDKIDGGEKPGNYANDPVPAGVRSPANVRMYASHLALALLMNVTDKPGHICVNMMNGAWTPADPNQGLNNRWLGLFEVDLGKPLEEPARVVQGQKDTADQGVTIAARMYERGYVVYRRIDVAWDIPTVDYAATYEYVLPPSTGRDGKWCRVRSDGSLDTPTDRCQIASDEGLIFVPAP